MFCLKDETTGEKVVLNLLRESLWLISNQIPDPKKATVRIILDNPLSDHEIQISGGLTLRKPPFLLFAKGLP